MAKELLVTRELNREMIDAGASLVAELESQGFDATAILWLYFDEAETWRIVIGSSDVDKLGPRKVYQQIQAILRDMKDDPNGLSLPDISVVGDKSSPIRALRREATTTGGIGEGRLRGSVDRDYIVDSYVYKVKPLRQNSR
jgi:hypothetical protein